MAEHGTPHFVELHSYSVRRAESRVIEAYESFNSILGALIEVNSHLT